MWVPPNYYDNHKRVMCFDDGRERSTHYSTMTLLVHLEPFEYLFLEYCRHIIRQEHHPLKLEFASE